MDHDAMLGRIQTIFRDVFDKDDLIISPETNSDLIEEWDSLNHINLVVAIEKEFKLKFSLNELQPLKNVGEMMELMRKKMP